MQVRGDETNGEDKQSKRRWHVVCALSASSALENTRELRAWAGVSNENVQPAVNEESGEKKKGGTVPNTVVNTKHYFWFRDVIYVVTFIVSLRIYHLIAFNGAASDTGSAVSSGNSHSSQFSERWC